MALSEALKKKLAASGSTTAKGHEVQQEFVTADVDSVFKYERRRNVGLPDDPTKMSLDTVISLAQTLKEEQEQLIELVEEVDSYIWDGAYQFHRAMKELFGHAHGKTVQTFFGDKPPKMITIDISPTERAEVPWGVFSLPGFSRDEQLATGQTEKDGRRIFCVYATVKRKNSPLIKELCQRTRELVRTESIYKGKSIELPLTDDGKDIDYDRAPSFKNTSAVVPTELIFGEELEMELQANLFQMITNSRATTQLGIPTKRCICLAGKYGTGKSLTGSVAAKLCEEHNRTFVYIGDARALGPAINYMKMYGQVLVFAEDFDRVSAGERNAEMDRIANVLDGVDKSMDVLVILTTNHPEHINKVFDRSGRIDHIIGMETPDAKAAERLIHLYGRGFLDESADFSGVAAEFAAQEVAPANIREVVEGAKAYALVRVGDPALVKVTMDDVHRKLRDVQKRKKLGVKEVKEQPKLNVAMQELVQEHTAVAVKEFFTNGGAKDLAKMIRSLR